MYLQLLQFEMLRLLQLRLPAVSGSMLVDARAVTKYKGDIHFMFFFCELICV